MSLKSLKKAPKAASEEALLALLDKHCPLAPTTADASVRCNRFVAEDVAEKAAFERGDTDYTAQDIYTLLLCFKVLPQGTVMMGCGNILYSKAGSVWVNEVCDE